MESTHSTEKSIYIYKFILRTAWTYEVELWETSIKRNAKNILIFKNKCLRRTLPAPIYTDIPFVSEVITKLIINIETEIVTEINW